MLTILLNGKPLSLTSPELPQVLADHAHQTVFAVALNGEFIPRERYATVSLSAGDELEIVSPMQGG